MVRRPFRYFLSRFLPHGYPSAIYAIASGTVLSIVVLFWQVSSDSVLVVTGICRWILRFLIFALVPGFIWGLQSLGMFEPLGIREVFAGMYYREPIRTQFIAKGPYRLVRHPIYLLIIIVIWSCPDITVDRLMFNLLWSLWIIIASFLEERDLMNEFGDVYATYQKNVSMFIPCPWCCARGRQR